jgi:hypothetical protein
VDIVVKKDFSVTDIKQACLKAAAFRPSKATSGATNVLDQADLRKTVILCEDHFRAFRPQAKRDGYYEQREYPFVMGNCDYCKVFGRSQAYIHETVLKQVWVTREQDRRDREYATVVS